MIRMKKTLNLSYMLSTALLVASLWLVIPANQAYAVTLKQAVSQVERQYNGKVVSARTVTRGNKKVHVIRVITKDGVVKTVQIPE